MDSADYGVEYFFYLATVAFPSNICNHIKALVVGEPYHIVITARSKRKCSSPRKAWRRWNHETHSV
jgi:hypothetical protein